MWKNGKEGEGKKTAKKLRGKAKVKNSGKQGGGGKKWKKKGGKKRKNEKGEGETKKKRIFSDT